MSKVDERSDEADAALAEAAGVLNVANARLVRITERSLIDESWVGDGVHTPAQWLTYRAGLSPERAKVIVRVAERRVVSVRDGSVRCRRALARAGRRAREGA